METGTGIKSPRMKTGINLFLIANELWSDEAQFVF